MVWDDINLLQEDNNKNKKSNQKKGRKAKAANHILDLLDIGKDE